ncbi:hypothetical protein OROHE_022497 [Orobanche hederae]
MALSLLQSRSPANDHHQILQVVGRLERPCLHALCLGFRHPRTGENLCFTQMPPADFAETLNELRGVGTQKVACSVFGH